MITDTPTAPRALAELHIAMEAARGDKQLAVVCDARDEPFTSQLPDLTDVGVVVVLNVHLIDMPAVPDFELLAAYPSRGPKTTDIILGRKR